MARKKPAKPPRIMWALFDRNGRLFCYYDTKQEAEEDASDPVFRERGRPKYTIRAYGLLKRKEEPKP